MDAKDVAIPARRRGGGEQLQAEPGDMLGLVVGRPGLLCWRLCGGEERSGDDDDREDRAFRGGVADESGARATPRAQARPPAKEVERRDGERRDDEDDLHGERDAIRGLVEVVDQHEPIECLERPRGREQGHRNERGEREAPDRGSERARVDLAVVTRGEQDAPEEGDEPARPGRDREDVREVEDDAPQVPERRRVRHERRGHRRRDRRGERQHPPRLERRERAERHHAAAGERAHRPHERDPGSEGDRRQDQAGEGAHREHRAEARRKARALVEREGQRARDDERAGDREKRRLAARVHARWPDEDDEERGPQAERDARV